MIILAACSSERALATSDERFGHESQLIVNIASSGKFFRFGLRETDIKMFALSRRSAPAVFDLVRDLCQRPFQFT